MKNADDKFYTSGLILYLSSLVKMSIIMAGEIQEVPLSDIYMAKIRIKNDFKATPCTASIVTFYHYSFLLLLSFVQPCPVGISMGVIKPSSPGCHKDSLI